MKIQSPGKKGMLSILKLYTFTVDFEEKVVHKWLDCSASLLKFTAVTSHRLPVISMWSFMYVHGKGYASITY